MSNVLDDIFGLYRRKGDHPYGPEPLSQLKHALQCAQIAERFGANSAMIAAALLHDYGHLVGPPDDAFSLQGEHTWHAALGARMLSRHFPRDVTEPIRLHVTAKRHLCGTDSRYYETLSRGSILTLRQQGGLLTPADTKAFLSETYAEAAVLVRRWDDMSKDPAAATRDLEYFRPHLQAVLIEKRPIAAA